MLRDSCSIGSLSTSHVVQRDTVVRKQSERESTAGHLERHTPTSTAGLTTQTRSIAPRHGHRAEARRQQAPRRPRQQTSPSTPANLRTLGAVLPHSVPTSNLTTYFGHIILAYCRHSVLLGPYAINEVGADGVQGGCVGHQLHEGGLPRPAVPNGAIQLYLKAHWSCISGTCTPQYKALCR